MKKDDTMYDLIVVGGGASGMMMAGRAAELGSRVLLLEKNKELGKKLGTTGGGRCNITNAEFDVKVFLKNFPKAKEFLYSPFSKFSSIDTFAFFEGLGLPLVVEARKRAFPETQDATDVVRVLEEYVKKGRVTIKLGASIVKFETEKDKLVSVETKREGTFSGKYFSFATGGMAAPKSGSTGEGFSILEELGHTVIKPSPNIVPLVVEEEWVHELSGLSLSFMKIRFVQHGKTKIRKTGKLLFTHFGLSGPLILNSSHEVIELLHEGDVTAIIDLFPDTNEGDLDRRIWREFEKGKNKLLRNVLPDLIPEKLVAIILSFFAEDIAEKEVNSVTKEERKKIVQYMKNLTCTVVGTLGFDKAVIADGGVPLEEVDFTNMTSRNYSNLYLLGDVLHVNRPSGGYSLQLCWTTGWVAGSDAGRNKFK